MYLINCLVHLTKFKINETLKSHQMHNIVFLKVWYSDIIPIYHTNLFQMINFVNLDITAASSRSSTLYCVFYDRTLCMGSSLQSKTRHERCSYKKLKFLSQKLANHFWHLRSEREPFPHISQDFSKKMLNCFLFKIHIELYARNTPIFKNFKLKLQSK